MARIRHLAIASADPRKAAAFYVEALGLTEVKRFGFDPAAPDRVPNGSGVILTDGELNVTILKFSTDQLGHGMDYTGLHHIGFRVEDVAGTAKKLETLGVPVMMTGDQIAPGTHVELKYRGPENVVFDIADTPWLGNPPESKGKA